MGHFCSGQAREWVRGSVIGVGAFGTVSLALDKATGELLAVKSIECKQERKGELLAMENEINILKKLESPWIVRFLGENYTFHGGVCRRNLLMECLPGGSVADVVQRFGGQLEESVIKIYTKGILKGIEYLHSQGIVHSDIKGRNVLVGSSGVKLADFGSATIVGSEEGSKVGLSGTPLWMAPEVVNQMERAPPCDIWSLGCTMLEMATGRPPWSNIDHPLAAMYKIGCSDEIPEFPKTLSAECHDFLEKCFKRDPKQTWTSAQLLRHPFLSDCIHQEPESPTSTSNFQKTEDESGFCIIPSSTAPGLSLHRNQHDSMQHEEKGHDDNEIKRLSEESQSPRPSPCQRMAELTGKSSCASRPNWCLGPASNWIVVRSAKDKKPPILEIPPSDIMDGSFAQSTPSVQASHISHFQGSDLKGKSSFHINCEDVGAAHCKDPHTNMNELSQGRSNDPSDSHGFRNSMTQTVLYKDLTDPENNADVVDTHERRHGRNVALTGLKSKPSVCTFSKMLLNYWFGTSCALVNCDIILHLMLQTCLRQNSTRTDCCHVRHEATPSYVNHMSHNIIAIRVDYRRYRDIVYGVSLTRRDRNIVCVILVDMQHDGYGGNIFV